MGTLGCCCSIRDREYIIMHMISGRYSGVATVFGCFPVTLVRFTRTLAPHSRVATSKAHTFSLYSAPCFLYFLDTPPTALKTWGTGAEHPWRAVQVLNVIICEHSTRVLIARRWLTT